MQIISEQELKKFGKTFSLSKQAIALVNQQKATWGLAGANYRALKFVQTRDFEFGDFRLECQYNPERIRSSAANTGAEAIKARPCFLCGNNLPTEQLGISYAGNFLILCNPYPIFSYHLTIASVAHVPQEISSNLNTFLKLCYDLQEFTIFYNGPKCGASAPDHFHFQAGIKETLPIEVETENLLKNHAEIIAQDGMVTIFAVENYLRRLIYFTSPNISHLVKWIEQTVYYLVNHDNADEPMLNLLAQYKNNGWQVWLFPREAQRPRQYFAGDFDKIIVSPAAVELGGLVILPREEDFLKITAADLSDIFSQVTIQKNEFDLLKEKIKNFRF